eukprot:5191002-Pyramimonas_sp.AAC.1
MSFGDTKSVGRWSSWGRGRYLAVRPRGIDRQARMVRTPGVKRKMRLMKHEPVNRSLMITARFAADLGSNFKVRAISKSDPKYFESRADPLGTIELLGSQPATGAMKQRI